MHQTGFYIGKTTQTVSVMITLILLTILALTILGKPVDWLLEKLGKVDWKKLASDTWDKIVLYSKRAGRAATRYALLFYYTMVESELKLLEKVLIVAGIIYIIVPRDFLPKRTLGLFGLIDDAAVAAWIYERIKDNITPEIIQRTEDTLNDWFGPEVVTGLIADLSAD